MGIISYAQNFEDVLLNRVFGGLNYGFYVDVGAYSPVDDSVTKAFYDRGWSGINIEPGEIFEELVAARPRDVNLRMAVLDRSGEISFAQHPGWYAGLSHVLENGPSTLPGQSGVEMRSVACDTLTNILSAHAQRHPIAFLKIDVEGSELAIIRSTDWRTIRPTVLVIEATMPLSTQLDNQAWEPILLEQGYVRAYFDGINCFYVPEERSDLLRHFELPVNVLDGFARPDPPAVAACREELRAAQERILAVSTELDRTNAENTKLQEQNAILREQNAVYADLMRTHADTLSELRQQHNDRVANLQAERDSLNFQLHRAGQLEVMLSGDAARLHRLVRELRWPGGPGSVRAVLPLARMLRRLRGTRPPAMVPVDVAAALQTQPAPDDHLPASPPARSRSALRRLALLCYAPIRPFARPTARRVRAFLTAEIQGEMAQLNDRLELLLGRPGLAQGDTHCRFTTGDLAALKADLYQFGKLLETTLLTLALERTCMPPLIDSTPLPASSPRK
jgi:FkbM family methyltransferase